MRVVTMNGPGLHRGMELGSEIPHAIAETATALKAHLAARGHPPDALATRLATKGLAYAAAEHTPDLWAEVTALAGASRVPLDDVLLLTFLDEVWALTRSVGCSALARTVPPRPGEPASAATTEIGQTMDLPSWTEGRALVLRIGADHAPTALVLSYPGSIGLCGANEAGLGVAVNALSDAPFDEHGLGVAFVTRHLLTLTTLAEAAAFLPSVPHAAGQAYTIAAPDGIATFEADADGVRRVSEPGCARVAHTNHSLDADPGAREPSTSSRERLTVLTDALAQGTPFADVLSGDLVLDGRRWNDTHLTLGAFRAIGNEPVVRFLDGAAARGGRREWDRVPFR